MIHEAISSAAERVSFPRGGRGSAIGLFWAFVFVVSFSFGSAERIMAATEEPPPPFRLHGGGEDSCKGPSTPTDKHGNQQIKIIVKKPAKPSEYKYDVTVEPVCAELKHKGSVTFIMAFGYEPQQLDPGEHVGIDFDSPAASKPTLVGPFDKKGCAKKRGSYENVQDDGALNHCNKIPAKAVSKEIDGSSNPWITGYTVKIFDSNSKVVGFYDPGVKVIDSP